MTYFLDINEEKCAKYHCDAHVITQIEELVLMLSNCHKAYGSFDDKYMRDAPNLTEYRWIKKSSANYKYIALLAWNLCEEFRNRYTGMNHHLSRCVDELLVSVPSKMSNEPLSWFPAPPTHDESSPLGNEDIVLVWREYYVGEKSMVAKWAYTLKPEWYPRESLSDCLVKGDFWIEKYISERINSFQK